MLVCEQLLQITPADEDEAARKYKRVMNWLLAAVFSCVFELGISALLRWQVQDPRHCETAAEPIQVLHEYPTVLSP